MWLSGLESSAAVYGGLLEAELSSLYGTEPRCCVQKQHHSFLMVKGSQFDYSLGGTCGIQRRN
jgi:hypothetical protein